MIPAGGRGVDIVRGHFSWDPVKEIREDIGL